MKKTLATLVILLTTGLSLFTLAQDIKTDPADSPETIVFKSKLGNVTFDHRKHQERNNNDCKVCHNSLFTQSEDPIHFAAAMHRIDEAKKLKCAHCHNKDNNVEAFAITGNCDKCHVK